MRDVYNAIKRLRVFLMIIGLAQQIGKLKRIRQSNLLHNVINFVLTFPLFKLYSMYSKLYCNYIVRNYINCKLHYKFYNCIFAILYL